MGDVERREDYDRRDRIDEIGTKLTGWAVAEAAKNETWREATSESLAKGLEGISKRLTLAIVIAIVFIAVGLGISGLALGKAVGRQEAIQDAQSKTASLTDRVADAVDQIKAQRITNFRALCEREETSNGKTYDFLKRNGSTPAALRDYAAKFPRQIDCEKRVDAVRVKDGR